MKNLFLLLLIVVGFLFLQCSRDPEVSPQSSIDYEKKEIRLMQELTPQIVGRWTLQQVNFKYLEWNTHNNSKINLNRDTVFYDFATLNIKAATGSGSWVNPQRYPQFEGTIQFKGKTYPIHFYLLAGAGRVIGKKGPHATFLFEYNFPVGSHFPDTEELFLEHVGLMGENFSLEMERGQQTMTWKGLNRSHKTIKLIKN